ncbi:MAG: glycosyltransferase family 39 protein [Planctomycetales bacterium]|nr:glycosyltransferase family 39 protein [Planctomycetales bacterium]
MATDIGRGGDGVFGCMSQKNRTSYAFAIVLLLIAGAALRGYRCFSWPLDGDEVYTLHNSRVIHWGIDPAELTGRIYALCPLSFYLNRPLLDAGFSDAIAIRLLPLLAGITACAVLWWLCLNCFGPRVALIATALLVFNPYHVEMSQYGRYYSLVLLLANVSLLLFYEALRDRAYRKLAVSMFALLLAILSHLPAAFLLPAQFVVVLLHWFASRRDEASARFSLRSSLVLAALAVALAGYAYPAIGQWEGVRQAGGRSPPGLLAGWTAGAGLGVALLNAFGIAYLAWRRDVRLLLPLFAQAVPCAALLAMALAGKTVMPQFVGYVYFPMFLVGGLAIDSLFLATDGESTTAKPRLVIALMLCLAIAPSLPSLASQYVDGNRHDFPAAIEAMRPAVEKGGLVFSSWPHVFAYHARQTLDVPIVTSPEYDPKLAEEIRAGKLVVVQSPDYPILLGKPDFPYREPGSIWVVQKVERDRDDTKFIYADKRILFSWDPFAAIRLEVSHPRFDHRRNRLDVFRIDETRFGKRLESQE